MKASNLQTDFRGGFWSEEAQGRMDDPNYRRGLNECYNALPVKAGAWDRRLPFRAIGFTKGAGPAKLMSLAGVTKNQYNMVVSDGYIRFTEGGFLVTDATQQIVTGINTAKPSVVTTQGEHGWDTGDNVIFNMIGNAGVELAFLTSRVLLIERISATTFALYDLITGKAIDGTVIAFDPAFEVYVSRIAEVATPYAGETWKAVKRVQTDTETVLFHPATPLQSLTFQDAGNNAFSQVEITPALLKDGPYLDAQTGSTVSASALTGVVTLTFSFEAWSATKAYDKGAFVAHTSQHWKSLQGNNVNNTPAEGSAYWERVSALSFLPKKSFSDSDIGRHIRLKSEPADWASGTSYVNGDKVKHNSAYWMAIAAVTGAGANEPGSDATKWVPYASALKWTWGKIVSATGGGTKIDPTTATAKIGDMTAGGGLSKLFDGTFSTQLDTQSAQKAGATAYAGLQLASASAIASARIHPSKAATPSIITTTLLTIVGSTGGYAGTYTFQKAGAANVTFNLRGKATAPSSASDGTLLGTSGTKAYNEISKSPIVILSTDSVTTWDYVWIEIIASSATGNSTSMILCASEVEFYSAGAAGNAVTLEILGDPLLHSTTVREWRLGRYNDTDPTYPLCGTFHQGRLYLGSVNHWDASRPNKHFDFAPTEPDGTVTEGTAISYSFNTKVKAPIIWMHPGDDGVVVGTEAGEGLIFSTANNESITAVNANFVMKTFYGVSEIEPQQAPLTTLFVHQDGATIHEYMRDAYSGRPVAPSLSEKAPTLAGEGFVQIAYQGGKDPVLWACNKDFQLVGTSYNRSNLLAEEAPDMNAWHWHAHGGERDFISVSVGPNLSLTGEALTVITKDVGSGLHRIEIAADALRKGHDVFDCHYFDGMYVPSSGGTSVVPSDNLDETGGVEEIEDPPVAPPPAEPQWRMTGWTLMHQCASLSPGGAPPTGTSASGSGDGAVITPPTDWGAGPTCDFTCGFTEIPQVPGYNMGIPPVSATEVHIRQWQVDVFGLSKWFRYQTWEQTTPGVPWSTPTWS